MKREYKPLKSKDIQKFKISDSKFIFPGVCINSDKLLISKKQYKNLNSEFVVDWQMDGKK